MTVTAILPVPVGLAGRQDAVFASVAGMSPLVRVVRALEKRCDVVVAAAEPLVDAVRAALVEQGVSRVRVVVSASPGDRAQCVAAGLAGLSDSDDSVVGGSVVQSIVLHDIEWPIVPAGALDRIVNALRDGAVAVMPTRPVTDSVKVMGVGGVLAGTVDRAELRTVQYPRGFDADVLTLLVERSRSGAFDELEAVLSAGTPLTVIEGDDEALSVELPRDADYLAALIEGRRYLAGQ